VKRIEITMTSDDFYGVKTDHVLNLEDKRFGIGLVPPGREARQVFEGPMVPGPWAYTYGLGVCICADPRRNTGAESARKKDEGTEHVIEQEG